MSEIDVEAQNGQEVVQLPTQKQPRRNSVRDFIKTTRKIMNKKMRERRHSVSDFFRTAHTVMLLRNWVKRARGRILTRREQLEEHNISNENIKRIFILGDGNEDEGEPITGWWRKILYFTTDETSSFYYWWTVIVCLGCLYNLVTVVVLVFEEVAKKYYVQYAICNVIFDIIFLLDVLFLTRKEYRENGVRIRGIREMLLHRISTREFVFDALSVIPSDIIQIAIPRFSLARANRLFKCYRLAEYNGLTEIRTTVPNLFRVSKLILTCYIIFHWNGCLYFLIGIFYGFENAGLDDWVVSYEKIADPIVVKCDLFDAEHENFCQTDQFDDLRLHSEWDNATLYAREALEYWAPRMHVIHFSNLTKQYGLSFYWSALTLVTLGEQAWPNTTFQCIFEITDTLLGLVMFATILGDVGNMVTNMNSKKSQFQQVKDGCLSYMKYRSANPGLADKARNFFVHQWEHGIATDEQEIADFLPPRLYGQLAIHIHMETLRKVKLFEDCDPSLLYELILRLKLREYCPMDYICRKGEVGTEMYVVKEGFVEVVSEDGKTVFVRLGENSVFGELAILNIPGNKNGNKRTASIRSVGFSDLYVLSKEDLWAALREYPDAKESLMRKGRDILRRDKLLDDSIDDIDDVDPTSPVEVQLETIAVLIEQLDKQVDEQSKIMKERSDYWKHRLRLLEVAVVSDIKKLEDECNQLEEDIKQKKARTWQICGQPGA